MTFDASKLSPAPWAAYALPAQSTLGDEWANVAGLKRVYRDRADGFTPADAEFIALARNAFDVMMRRGWWPKTGGRGWYVSNQQMIEATANLPEDKYPNRIWPDPFTALVEADRWFTANEQKQPIKGSGSGTP